MKKDLRNGVYDRYFSDPKKRLVFRIMGGVGLIFDLVILIALSLLFYSMGKTVGLDNIYWLAMVIILICSLLGGGFIFLLLLRKNKGK